VCAGCIESAVFARQQRGAKTAHVSAMLVTNIWRMESRYSELFRLPLAADNSLRE